MPTFETQRQDSDNRNLIRKIQLPSRPGRPYVVELPDSLFDVGGSLVDLKALGYLPFGIVTPDGYEFGRDVSSEDVNALGYSAPYVRTSPKWPAA